MISLIVILALSYLAGSVPTAIMMGHLILKDDIRNHGSKNAGATNVFRVMGWKPALVVFLIDAGKGVLAVLLISQIRVDVLALQPSTVQVLAGAMAMVGHIWTVFAGFKGGKGVGTALGVFLALVPEAALIALATWILMVWLTRIVSVASIVAALVFGCTLIVQKFLLDVPIPMPIVIVGVALATLIVVKHRSNIQRLLKGEENKFGSSKGKKGANA